MGKCLCDEKMLESFLAGYVSVICRNESEFKEFMDFLEFTYDGYIIWNDGKKPTGNAHFYIDEYGANTILKIVTGDNGNMLYGLYDGNIYDLGYKDVYADDIMVYRPINISVNELNDFLSI